MEGFWLGLSFVITSLLATTAVPSLPSPLSLLPLMLMSGILVMNRVSVVHGAAWLVLSGIVLEIAGTAPGRIVAYGLAGVVGFVAAERVFAKRSVYALLGLGVTTGSVFSVFELLHRVVGTWLNSEGTAGMTALEALWTLILLTGSLYVGFIIAVSLRRWLGKTFVVRSL